MATNQNATITKTEIRKGDCILKEIDASEILHRPFASNFLKRIGRGTAVGMATGLIVTTFRKIIDDTLQGLNVIYPYMRIHYLALGSYLIGTLILWLIMARLLKNHLFDIVGSGVPQVEDVLHDEHWMSWWSVLWRKYLIGLMAICPGLFLGREGPCIQMGAAVGQGLAEKCFKSPRHETKVMIACGIAAGLSAAFSAPLAGALFLLEEITYTFESQTWLTALTAAIASDLVTLLFFGTRPCMWLPVTYRLLPATYLPLALFGILLGILAWFYQYCLINIHCWYGKITWLPRNRRAIIPLLLVVPIGLWDASMLGGSHVFVEVIAQLPRHVHGFQAMMMLLGVYFIIRFVFSMISYGAAVPGGIFMPILVLGAILGGFAGCLMIRFGLIPAKAYINLVVIGMVAYFGAIEMAPFTAICLLTEMVGTIQQILPMLLVTFIAYTVNDLLGGRPIYGALREQMAPQAAQERNAKTGSLNY